MTKLFAAMLALCMLMTPVLSLAEVTPETLEGIYKGDALGYYAGWYKDINNVTRDVLFDQETLNRNAEGSYPFHYVCEEGEDILLYSNGFMFIQGTDGSVHPLIDVIVCVLSDGVCGWQDELPAYGDVSTLGYYDAVLDREDREGLPEIAAADIHFHDMSFDLM